MRVGGDGNLGNNGGVSFCCWKCVNRVVLVFLWFWILGIGEFCLEISGKVILIFLIIIVFVFILFGGCFMEVRWL